MSAQTRNQKVIVEPDPDGGVLVLLDNGDVRSCANVSHAARLIATRATSGNPGVTITTIEWRGGLKPPRG